MLSHSVFIAVIVPVLKNYIIPHPSKEDKYIETEGLLSLSLLVKMMQWYCETW
jgi:hypothetical protein